MIAQDLARPCLRETPGMGPAASDGIAARRRIVKTGRRGPQERRPAVAGHQLAAFGEVAAGVLQICPAAAGFETVIRDVIAELPEPVRPGPSREAAALARQRGEQQFAAAVTGRLM
jgi:hypothetical protein